LKSHIIKALGQTGVTGETRDGMDASLCIWHKDTNILEFAGAYNPLYIVSSRQSAVGSQQSAVSSQQSGVGLMDWGLPTVN